MLIIGIFPGNRSWLYNISH